MKKNLYSAVLVATALFAVACTNNQNSTDNAEATQAQDSTEAVQADEQQAPDPLQRDFESADLSLTIPEGWTGEVGAFEEIIMRTKGENGSDLKMAIDVIKDANVKELVANDMDAYPSLTKTEGVKIGDYTFTILSNGAGQTTSYAQVSDNVLRMKNALVDPDAPEVAAVLSTIKLK